MKKIEHPREMLINSMVELAIPTLSHLLKRNGIKQINLGNSNETFVTQESNVIRNDGFILFYEHEKDDLNQYVNYRERQKVLKEMHPKDFFDLHNHFTTYQLISFSERLKKTIEDLLHIENSALNSVNYFKENNIDYNEKKILIELNRD